MKTVTFELILMFAGHVRSVHPAGTKIALRSASVFSYVNILKNGCGHGDVSYYTKVQ